MYIIILTIVTKLGIAQSHLWLCGIVFVTAEHWYVACKIGFIDFSPHGQFAPWTFCPTLDISPHGRSPMGDSPQMFRPMVVGQHVHTPSQKRFTLRKPWRYSRQMQFFMTGRQQCPSQRKICAYVHCTMQCTYHFDSSRTNTAKAIDRQAATSGRLVQTN